MKYQFTLFSETYKPVSCIVEANNVLEFMQHGTPYKKAIQKICMKRSWTLADLKKYGYSKMRVRKVDENGKPVNQKPNRDISGQHTTSEEIS